MDLLGDEIGHGAEDTVAFVVGNVLGAGVTTDRPG